MTGLGVKGSSSSKTNRQLTNSQGSESSVDQSIETCALLKPMQLTCIPEGSEAATESLDYI